MSLDTNAVVMNLDRLVAEHKFPARVGVTAARARVVRARSVAPNTGAVAGVP